MMFDIYGGTGIIGSYFNDLMNANTIPRNQLHPIGANVLYLISTTSNSYNNPLLHTNTNIDCLMKRLIACQEKGIESFNFVSSWFVYQPKEGQIKEEDYCSPKGLYSITKYCAEQLVIDFCSHHEIKWRILRLGNVYGGPDKSDGKRNALHYIVQSLKNHHPVQGVFGMKRDYIHIYDTCRAINLICKQGAFNTIYNIGSGNSALQSECIDFCRNILQSNSPISYRSHRNNEQALTMALDCTKLFSLGFSPLISLEEGLFDLCTDQKFSIPAHFSMGMK